MAHCESKLRRGGRKKGKQRKRKTSGRWVSFKKFGWKRKIEKKCSGKREREPNPAPGSSRRRQLQTDSQLRVTCACEHSGREYGNVEWGWEYEGERERERAPPISDTSSLGEDSPLRRVVEGTVRENRSCTLQTGSSSSPLNDRS